MCADTRQPEPGTLSQDEQFVWTGSDWAPAGGAFGTGWTRPLQRVVAVFFLVSVVVSLLNTFVLGAAAVTVGFALVLAAIYLLAAGAPSPAHTARR